MTRFLSRSAVLLACATAVPSAAVYAQTAPARAAATAQPAAQHPDLSGTWELNVAKSTFAQGAPAKGTMTLVQAGDKITTTQTIETPMGTATNTMRHTVGVATTDTINAAGQQTPFTSTARWDNATFVIEGKVVVQGTDIPVVSRYTLTPDGRQLIVDQTITTPIGELPSHFVYERKG